MSRGADPNLVDAHIGATPWQWANHFHHDDVAAFPRGVTDHPKTDDPGTDER